MKDKFLKYKIWLAIAALLIIVGGLMFAGGMTALGWDFYELDGEELESQSFAASGEDTITSITLSAEFDYNITSGESTTIDYYTSNQSEIELKQEGNELTLKEDVAFLPSIGLNFGNKRDKVTVDVTIAPTVETIVIKMASCDVMINGASVNSVSVDSASSDVEIKNSTIRQLEINAASLDMWIYDSTIEGLKVDSAVADVEVESSFIKQTEANCVRGDFIMEKTDIYSLYADCTSMDIELELVGKASDFAAITASGAACDVEVDGKDGNYSGSGYKTIELKGTSSDLEVEFLGGETIYTA